MVRCLIEGDKFIIIVWVEKMGEKKKRPTINEEGDCLKERHSKPAIF